MSWQQCGGEINLLLLAVWHGERRLGWSEAYAKQLLGQTRHWRKSILQPMRQLRASIKREIGAGAEYEQAKQMELRLERRFQLQLCEYDAPSKASAEPQMRENLEMLYRLAGMTPPAMKAGDFAALWRSR